MARSMLKEKGLPDSFWAKSVACVVHILNLSPTKVVWDQTPYEAWHSTKPLRVYDPISGKITISRNVVFDEQGCWNWEDSFKKSNSQVGEYEEEFQEEPQPVVVLYGLKQAARAWYSKIDDFFHKNGFDRSMHEPTLYVKRQGKDDIMIVSLYVDDIIYTGSSPALIAEFQNSMKNTFDMTDLGMLCYFLGLEITQTSDGIFMSKRKYVEDTLKRFNMVGCNTVTSPININEKLKPDDEIGATDVSLYISLIGCLIYLTHSFPDLSFSVGMLSRFMHKPTKQYFGAAKRVLRYLACIKEYGMWFWKVEVFKLKGFCNSDYGNSVGGAKSTSGSCFILGTAVVSWSSKKQAIVALSSTKAEYIAAASVACQAVWLRRLLSDLGQEQNNPTNIFCDSMSTILLVRNPVFHF
ncbi:retrovirus-related pol polyprotein from transposon TNT 1-94 [Tanacetum coccineum]